MNNPQINNLNKMLEIYKEFYITRDDIYALQRVVNGTGIYNLIQEPLTNEILMQHLQGIRTIGFYVVGKDNKAKFMNLDFDNKENPQLSFNLALKCCEELSKSFPNSVIASFSGQKGYHIDLFVEPIEAWNIRKFNKPENKIRLGFNELSPKQDYLTEQNPIGNLIKHAPCLHQVSGKWSLFWDMEENRAMTENEVFSFFDNCENIKLNEFPDPRKTEKKIESYKQPIMIKSLAVKKYPPCIQNILSRDLQDGRHRTLMILSAFFHRIGFNQEEIKNILYYKHFGILLEGFEPNSKVQEVLSSIQPITNTSIINFNQVFEHEYSNVINGNFGIPNCNKIRDKIGGYFGGEFGLADINVCDKACKLYRSIKQDE